MIDDEQALETIDFDQNLIDESFGELPVIRVEGANSNRPTGL